MDKLATEYDKIFQLHLNNVATGTNTCPQPWPPLINGLVDDALLELSSEINRCCFCKVVWHTAQRLQNFVAYLLFSLPVYQIKSHIPALQNSLPGYWRAAVPQQKET